MIELHMVFDEATGQVKLSAPLTNKVAMWALIGTLIEQTMATKPGQVGPKVTAPPAGFRLPKGGG